jgi:hypothetical protein
MRDEAFQTWRRECEAVEREMDRLISGGVPASPEERQVRRMRFTALVERREAAARRLIQTDRDRYHRNLGLSPDAAAIPAAAAPSDVNAPTAGDAALGPDFCRSPATGPAVDQSAQTDATIPVRPDEDVVDLNARQKGGE